MCVRLLCKRVAHMLSGSPQPVTHSRYTLQTDTIPCLLIPSLCAAGEQLAGCQYAHPLCDRVSRVLVGGDWVTADSGTGLVHSAPGHGQEDYQVWTPLKSP